MSKLPDRRQWRTNRGGFTALTSAVILLWGIPSCGNAPAGRMHDPVGSLTSIPMRVGRALHTATRLADGRILIVGGGTPESPIPSAELLDLAAKSSKLIPMSAGRVGHTATLLPDGSVLVVGGGYGIAATTRSAELFEVATEQFRPVGRMVDARTDHVAVLLGTGKVLIAGGDPSGDGSSPVASAELYDPSTERFQRTGSMIAPRRPYGAVSMLDGTVLIAGGTSTSKRIFADAEVYDPTRGQFRSVGPLNHPREKHAAGLLRDGRVIIAGGSDGQSVSDRLVSTEFFDPRTGRFTAGPNLGTPRHKVTAVAVSDGSLLVAGGGPNLAEFLDPLGSRFEPVSAVQNIERFYPAAVTLTDGGVFISGGYTRGGSQRDTWVVRR
ncbi:MAG: kelch repeat-containing protein [Gemmatimonadaceae bacterium]